MKRRLKSVASVINTPDSSYRRIWHVAVSTGITELVAKETLDPVFYDCQIHIIRRVKKLMSE